MERSADRYLHKKFKKQLNIELSNSIKNETSNEQSAAYADTSPSGQVTSRTSEKSCNDVPKLSTNDSSFNVTVLESCIEPSSISVAQNETKQAGNPQSSNSCISYVISARVDPELQCRTNFDKKFYEPISSANASSNLDNVYSKKYVTSKLVNVDRGDISSTILSNEHLEELSADRSELKDSQPELGHLEKNSGGKYVCSYCNLACSKPSVLQKHIRAHTNERPYPCVSCGFSFKTRSNLYKHCRSRTHANRVMGNKVQEINNELDTDSQSRMDFETSESCNEDGNKTSEERTVQDVKPKPYKPRFHTAKAFFEDEKKSEDQKVPETTVHYRSAPNSDLLSLHINEVISKNNAIVNSNEPLIFKKRSADVSQGDNINNNEVQYSQQEEKHSDEPLNLTNKGRKRCMSDVGIEQQQPAMHTSLIKELLLKNLYADSMQCPHCKMIFQTVTELELHKMRSCKGYQKSGARYSRSSSVNVASILTKNKNAFDNIPHLQNTVFPQKSPGPFLGKTRLVESDKTKSFSFDDGLPSFQATVQNSALRYSVSPLTVQTEKKKPPVKLFGGEVKITHTSSKNFKIDSIKDGEHFIDYPGRLSENRVIKSSLQSGGTVLQNKLGYNPKQDPLRSSPDVIRVYDNSSLSPSLDLVSLEKTKFNFDRHQIREEDRIQIPTDGIGASTYNNSPSSSYKYTNIMDFSQKAVKLLAPNLKQPNLTVSGVLTPGKVILPRSSAINFEINLDESKMFGDPHVSSKMESPVLPKQQQEPEVRHMENMQFAQKQILLQQKMTNDPPPPPCNPVNLLVNGKVVRFVPGMPGPVAAEIPSEVLYRASSNFHSHAEPEGAPTPMETEPISESRIMYQPPIEKKSSKSPKLYADPKNEMKSPLRSDVKSPVSSEMARKFGRPTTLALKPSISAQKQHHGLTPTVFNQILISPDTPRVAKKYMQHFLNGNYFSYLGLKSSTKSVYCTLNKTQPSYVPHFKKLSMYSEWRQQDTKADKLYVSAYDSRQKPYKYMTAGKAVADLVVHSSYKFVAGDASYTKGEEKHKSSSVFGGYESNEEYTYVRGRGRGRYVCDQCGIRCKKPSMLKKHIRTHTNDRPFTCSHCNFSFKTKGNLTKHMKSKAHTKNYVASSSSLSTHQSSTQSSESDTDDSGMDSSDESTRQQEHEAAYGLLSLSQKTSQSFMSGTPTDFSMASPACSGPINADQPLSFMNAEQVTQVNNSTFAKNKFLDHQVTLNFNTRILETPTTSTSSEESENLTHFLGRTNANRPLTYPYTSDVEDQGREVLATPSDVAGTSFANSIETQKEIMPKVNRMMGVSAAFVDGYRAENVMTPLQKQTPILKVNDEVIGNSNAALDVRKRKAQEIEDNSPKLNRMHSETEAMDLSMPTLEERLASPEAVEPLRFTRASPSKEAELRLGNLHLGESRVLPHPGTVVRNHSELKYSSYKADSAPFEDHNSINLTMGEVDEHVNINYVIQEGHSDVITTFTEVPSNFASMDYDNSAMETLADVATKQVKLEKNTLAKSVASEFLKLATKHEAQNVDSIRDVTAYVPAAKEVNEQSEESKSCSVCTKSFNKPSQLRLHMNIHYLERPFRCDPCSVSFRTKGLLQKHERSAGHHNKLSSSPLLSSSEPRPFKCSDCKIAFRIHGHLAKHLRSKLHIMKLECLAKIPFGLYAELERANSLLTEINTTDGNQCLESLKALARKVFLNDPSKLTQLQVSLASSSGASDR